MPDKNRIQKSRVFTRTSYKVAQEAHTTHLLLNAVALDDPVKRAPIDAENLGGARAITAGDLEYRPLSIQQMAYDYADVARALRVYAKVESAAPVYVYGWSLGAGFAVAVGFDVQTRANWAGVISIGLPNRTSSSVVLAQITQT